MQLLFPVNIQEINRIITQALEEDIGKGDVTSEAVIPVFARAKLSFVAREDMVVAGLPILERMFRKIDAHIKEDPQVKEGQYVKKGTVLCSVEGNAREILLAERVALNVFQRMCGIATETKKYVEEVVNTKAKILDTRKTSPCIREIEKYAVRVGGGENHRMRLDDMVMIKDNHLQILARNDGGGVMEAVKLAKKSQKTAGLKIMIETDTMQQVEEALKTEADFILLDNMTLEDLKKAVAMRDNTRPEILLEASGGVTLVNVRDVAKTGVDRISIGALTHSVRNVDIGLDIL